MGRLRRIIAGWAIFFALYLFRRMGIASLSETSEELIVQIRRLSLPQQQFLDLAEALRMGDFVKFAKYQPGLADSESHYRTIRGAIEELDRRKEADERIQAAIAGQSNRDQPRLPLQQNN